MSNLIGQKFIVTVVLIGVAAAAMFIGKINFFEFAAFAIPLAGAFGVARVIEKRK
jgi:hypothetical protein